MKAVLCKAYGPPESLVIEDIEPLKPGRDQVVISVKACGVNFPDTLIIQAYQESFSYFRIEYGLVVGIIMMLVTIAMCALLLRRVTRKG